jgi:hypothetical protein
MLQLFPTLPFPGSPVCHLAPLAPALVASWFNSTLAQNFSQGWGRRFERTACGKANDSGHRGIVLVNSCGLQ